MSLQRPWLEWLATANAAPQRTGTRDPSVLLQAAHARRCSIEYQPVYEMSPESPDGEVIGRVLAWRARARFRDAAGHFLSTSAVFAALHQRPALLFSVELDLKRMALEQAPPTGQLLVALDADSYAVGAGSSGNAFDRLLCNRSRLVVEICENRPVTDLARVDALLRALASRKIPVALGASTPAMADGHALLATADWVRLRLPDEPGALREPRILRRLAALASAAGDAGVTTCVSGVRDAAQLATVRALGFSAACGPVFSCQEASSLAPRHAGGVA
jgi:EAL domain-containing protein (putative c-di-GMP-specific phosphodiesterase class I)